MPLILRDNSSLRRSLLQPWSGRSGRSRTRRCRACTRHQTGVQSARQRCLSFVRRGFRIGVRGSEMRNTRCDSRLISFSKPGPDFVDASFEPEIGVWEMSGNPGLKPMTFCAHPRDSWWGHRFQSRSSGPACIPRILRDQSRRSNSARGSRNIPQRRCCPCTFLIPRGRVKEVGFGRC